MRHVLSLFLLLLVAPSPAAARCQVNRVVDGDTLHLTCAGVGHRVRLLGYDAPELSHPRCAAEQSAAEQATEVMRKLVAEGPVTRFQITGQDRYGRDLAWLAIGGQDVTAVMLSSGLARPYQGGRRVGWCKGR
jgi:micrococcal nuclease